MNDSGPHVRLQEVRGGIASQRHGVSAPIGEDERKGQSTHDEVLEDADKKRRFIHSKMERRR